MNTKVAQDLPKHCQSLECEPAQDMLEQKLSQASHLLAAVYTGGSFSAAAEHLGLDPSAVSHRIRALESALGFNLFSRTTRRVSPTRAGRILCQAAERALLDLEISLTAARQLGSESAIRLSVHSSLAMRWFIPRLPSAQRAGLDIAIDVREELVDLNRGDVDAGLRFGPGPYPGLHATRLCSCDLQPVVAATHPAASQPEQRIFTDRSLTLLSDLGAEKHRTGTTWADYLRGLGRAELTSSLIKSFDRADLMLQAAIGGLGIALGRTLLIDDDVRLGLLVPVGERLRVTSSYWLVTTHELARTPKLAALTDWIKQQVQLSLGSNSPAQV